MCEASICNSALLSAGVVSYLCVSHADIMTLTHITSAVIAAAAAAVTSQYYRRKLTAVSHFSVDRPPRLAH